MRQLVWSKTFLRAYKGAIRRYPHLKTDIEPVLRLLVEDPFDPRLRTHKLKAQLEGTWACTIGYDMRLHCGGKSLAGQMAPEVPRWTSSDPTWNFEHNWKGRLDIVLPLA